MDREMKFLDLPQVGIIDFDFKNEEQFEEFLDFQLQDFYIKADLFADEDYLFEEMDVHVVTVLDTYLPRRETSLITKNEDFLVNHPDFKFLGDFKKEFLRVQEFFLKIFPTFSHLMICYFLWEDYKIPVAIFYYENMDVFIYCLKQENDSYFRFN